MVEQPNMMRGMVLIVQTVEPWDDERPEQSVVLTTADGDEYICTVHAKHRAVKFGETLDRVLNKVGL